MSTIKLQRGQKLCKNCEQPNASRQRECKWCGTAFVSKNTPLKGEIKDWKSLSKGALCRVVNGSGPYYLLTADSEEGREGEKMPMGHRGSYQIDKVVEEGIISFGISRKNRGMAFIYMGEDKVSKATNVYHTPHRIIKIKTRPKRL